MTAGNARLITIEGLEGAGKSSGLATVAGWLRQRGIDPLMTREPGGTRLGESVRELLLGNHGPEVSVEAEVLLVFAARAQHLAEVIRPALAAGRWVVSDRFTDASYAYQGGGRELGEARIEALEQWLQGPLRPDLTLYLDVPVRQGLDRAAARSAPDRFERERKAFFERARIVYRHRCTRYPERMRMIDASVEQSQVRRRIEANMEAAFGHLL